MNLFKDELSTDIVNQEIYVVLGARSNEPIGTMKRGDRAENSALIKAESSESLGYMIKWKG